MAKLADYKAKQDNLEEEITDASNAAQDRKESSFEIPDRFKGKSPEDIAQSYVELERAYSRQGQDMGQLRQSVDSLIELQVAEKAAVDSPPPAPVTVDDLYDDPEEAIGKVVDKRATESIDEIKAELQQVRAETAKAKFENEFPNYVTDIQDPKFGEWVRGSEYRVSMVGKADQDINAARELMSMYYDYSGKAAAKEDAAQRDEQLKNAALETGGAATHELVKTFSRAEILEKRIASKHGNQEAERWLKANSKAIHAAYEEGRVVD